jgi:hypothetical protein
MTDNSRIQLRRLAALQPRSPESLEAVLENIDALCGAALDQRRRYVSKHGEAIEYAAPDFSVALKAQELGAKLLVLTDAEATRASELVEMNVPLLERYLAKAGYALVPLDAQS